MTGTLFLIGVGPGDPELMTLKAVRVLREVPVIAYPRTGEDSTGNDNALALSIARAYLNPLAELLPFTIPMQPGREAAQRAYDDAASEVLVHLGAGRDVAWLCEGDPLFYGTAIYLMARIAGQAPVVVVPGVTSLTAAAAAVARPLGARNDVLKVLPAPLPDEALRAELASASSFAVIKVGRHFDRIRRLLEETGCTEGAMVVEHATTGRQRITPLADFAHDERPYFSTILRYRGIETGVGRGRGE